MQKIKLKHKLDPKIECRNCHFRYLLRLSPNHCPRCGYPLNPEIKQELL